MRLLSTLCLLAFFACKQQPAATVDSEERWQESLDKSIPFLGHRNWILVVDKAFPAQSTAGIEVVDTGKELPEVLSATLTQLKAATHVTPVIYQDKELASLNNSLFPGVDTFKAAINKQLSGYQVQAMLHDTVFARMASTAAKFKVLVLKTETAIPYSSVFLELDCRYWGPEKETALRKVMNEAASPKEQ